MLLEYTGTQVTSAEVQTHTMGKCSLLLLAVHVPTLLIPVISPVASFQPHTTRSSFLQPQWKRIFPSISATQVPDFSFHSLPMLHTNCSTAFTTRRLKSTAHRPSLELLCCTPVVSAASRFLPCLHFLEQPLPRTTSCSSIEHQTYFTLKA